MTIENVKTLMEKFKEMQEAVNTPSHPVPRHVEDMKNIIKLIKDSEANQPSSRESSVISSVIEFMSFLTLEDSEVFARDLRRAIDNAIEGRLNKTKNDWGERGRKAAEASERIKDQLKSTATEATNKIPDSENIESTGLLEALDLFKKLQEFEKSKMNRRGFTTGPKSEDKNSCSEPTIRELSILAGLDTNEVVNYSIKEENGNREIIDNIDNTVPPQDTAISIVETIPGDHGPQPTPESAFPGFLTLEDTIKSLKVQRKKIAAALQEPHVLDNPEAFDSFTKQLTRLSGTIDMLKGERTRRKSIQRGK